MRRHRAVVSAAAFSLVVTSLAITITAAAQTVNPGIFVSLTSDYIFTNEGFTPNSSATFEIFDSPGGGRVFGPESHPTDGNGQFFLAGSVHEQDLLPGMQVVVTDDTTAVAAALTLEPVAINSVDRDLDLVSGTAPPGRTFDIQAGSQSEDLRVVVTSLPDGSWSADFAAQGLDITADHFINALLPDQGNNFTIAEPPPLPGFLVRPPRDAPGFYGLNHVHGGGWPVGATVTLTIDDPATPAPVDYTDELVADDPGNPCCTGFVGFDDLQGFVLAAGHIVTLTDGISTKTHVVTELMVNDLDADTDTVSGTAEPGSQVNVFIDSPTSGQLVTADAITGDWSFIAPVDIDVGLDVFVTQDDEDGDRTSFVLTVHPPPQAGPTIIGSLTSDWVVGYGWNSDATVTVDINGGAQIFGGVPVSGDAGFLLETGLDLTPGDVIVVTGDSSGSSAELTLVNLTFDGPDPTTELLAGTADPGTQVHVTVGNSYRAVRDGVIRDLTATADASGAWTADFGSVGFDVTPEMTGEAFVFDTEGDATFVDPPNPWRISASLSFGWVAGNGWGIDSSVTIDINGGTHVFGGVPVIRDQGNGFQPGGQGDFFIDTFVGLNPGDVIVVTGEDTGLSRSLTLVPLTFDSLDPSTDVAAGTADPGTEVQVELGNEFGLFFLNVTTGAGGRWQADFSTIGFDVTEESGGIAQAFEDDADATVAEVFQPPQPVFLVRPPAGPFEIFPLNHIHGFDWPDGATVTLTIDDPATIDPVDYTDQTTVTFDGCCGTFLEFQIEGFVLAPGQTVELTDGTTKKTHVITELAVTDVDADTDTVSGTAEPGTDVTAFAEDFGRTTTADAVTGQWTINLGTPGPQGEPPIDIGPGTEIHVVQPDDDGDETSLIVGIPPPPAFEVRPNFDEILGGNWPNGATVTLTVDDPGTQEPVDYTDQATVIFDPCCGTFIDFFTEGFDLVPGQLVQLTDDTTTKTHTITNLTISVIDDDNDIVSGLADPDANVIVGVIDEFGDGVRFEVADASGNWSADFSVPGDEDGEESTVDIDFGGTTFEVQAQEPDDDGDSTGIVLFPPPEPSFLVRQATPFHLILWNDVHGFNWPEGATVTLTVDDPATPPTVDYMDSATAATIPGEPCCVGFVEFVPTTFTFTAGHVVTLTDGVTTKTHVVTNLTVTDIDEATDTVTGTADPGSDVFINVFGEFGFADRSEVADANGNWIADFSVPGDEPSEEIILDIAPGQDIHVSQTDEDNDSTDFEMTPPISVGPIVGPTDPVSIGAEVNFSAPFNSPDVVRATWDLGDGTLAEGSVDISDGGGSTDIVHTYTEPGVYEVFVAVTDDRRQFANTSYQFVVVYDPDGGFVTGGGWIQSEAGWCQLDAVCEAAEGKANFGFVSRYKKGKNTPDGNTEFNFTAGGLNFHSESYDWLVVNQGATNAQYKGSGTINGASAPNGAAYKFMIWAKDRDPDDVDTFRIRIWYEEGGAETVVYHNGFDQAIGGGNIQVHQG